MRPCHLSRRRERVEAGRIVPTATSERVRAAGWCEPGEAAAALVLENVRLTLGDRVLVTLDAAVAPGETLTVMGPSGAGKSALLAWLVGALPAAFKTEGRVLLDGRDVTALVPERRGIGLLFQDALLFPHLSVAQNLLVALPASVVGRARRRLIVEATLASAGLGGLGERDPATLSGGQAARVALLRTLLAQPRALLLDEPFGKLDTALREQIRGLVFAEVRRRRLPAILVTHDPADARSAGGPVHVLASEDASRGEAGRT